MRYSGSAKPLLLDCDLHKGLSSPQLPTPSGGIGQLEQAGGGCFSPA